MIGIAGILSIRGNGGGGGGANPRLVAFNTVDAQTSYTSGEVGVDLTGTTLYVLFVNGAEVYQQSNASVNGGGGIDFTFNPGNAEAVILYNN